MQDRALPESYLKKQNWNAANEWIQTECRLLHGKVLRQRITQEIDDDLTGNYGDY